MALIPGQIVGADLSPTANILGTQIADKTLLFRNFSEDTFKIVKTGTKTLSGYTVALSAGNYTTGGVTDTVAHNLGFVPAVIAYIINLTSTYELLPSSTVSGSGTSAIWTNVTVRVDSTNIYIVQSQMNFNQGSTVVGGANVRYYLLQETAN